MKLSEFEKKLCEMEERLIAAGKMVPRGTFANSEEHRLTDTDRITVGAIFMPPRRNREEVKQKWQAYRQKRLRKENTVVLHNSIFVIAPYLYEGTWVFDDDRVGLAKEPFVSGVPDMINYLVREIPDAQDGFRMFFSKNKYPGYSQSLSWRSTEYNGNWYQMEVDPLLSGWLCPALSHYFPEPPEKLYVSAEPLVQAS